MRSEYTDGEDPINTFANSINNDYEPLKGKVYSMMYKYINSYCSISGNEYSLSDINIPYTGKGSVRLYTQENDKRTYKIFQDRGLKPEELGDIFFIIKDSKASPRFTGE
ncbi:hypothetical protein [Clostridium sp.]|uniref:hypothetical protein n=1 Tax=Clostridium sp. TaxID=1506 RepID=UPI0032162FB1